MFQQRSGKSMQVGLSIRLQSAGYGLSRGCRPTDAGQDGISLELLFTSLTVVAACL